jgi:hypothetical protein
MYLSCDVTSEHSAGWVAKTSSLTNFMERIYSWEDVQLLKKFSAFYGKRQFITVSTTVHH